MTLSVYMESWGRGACPLRRQVSHTSCWAALYRSSRAVESGKDVLLIHLSPLRTHSSYPLT